MAIYNKGLKYLIYSRGKLMSSCYHKGAMVYQSTKSYSITYCVDTSDEHTEMVNEGASILNPTTFTPTKSGYTFVGWRSDNSASSDVLVNIGASQNTTLYAVFSKAITVTYNANGGSGSTSSSTGDMYYNNGNTIGATISLRSSGFTAPTNKTFSQWAMNSASGTKYSAGTSVTLTANATFYAIWEIIVLSNYLWKSGSGVGDWTFYYDFTNYRTVTIKAVLNQGWSCRLNAVSPVKASDQDNTELSITFTPQSGSQSIRWRAGEKPEYGIESANMTWKLYITAS